MVPLGVNRWKRALRRGGGGNFLVGLTRYVPLCMVSVYGIFTLKESIQLHYLASQDDVTRDDSQRRLLAQHVVAMSEQCCNYLKQYCNNVVTVCFRRFESSRLTSPLNRVAVLMHFALNRVRIEGFQQHSPNPDLDLPPPPSFLPLSITTTRRNWLHRPFFRLKNGREDTQDVSTRTNEL